MKRTFALLVAAAFLFPAAAHAAETPMAPVECTNLGPGECTAVEAVFADSYAIASGTLVARSGPAQVAPAPSAPTAADAAAAPAPSAPLPPSLPPSAPPSGQPATAYLRVSAVRLTSRIVLRASLNRGDGSVIHAVEMTASSLDDIQPAADRMTRALVNRTSVGQTMNLKNITRTEGRAPNRTFTEKVVGLKTAIIMPFANDIDLAPMMSVQFDARFEADMYFLEFGAGLALPSDASDRRGYGGLFSEFGGSVYLGDESPLYLGAGVIPRLFFSNDGGGVQAAFYGQVGLMFMRTSSTRLYTELRVSQNALPVTFERSYSSPTTSSPYGTYNESRSKYPTEFALQVGIGW